MKVMNAVSRQLEREVYTAHRRWFDAGGSGDGRLTVSGQSLLGFVASALDLSGARFHDCNLSNGNLSNTTLAGAELRGCVLFEVNLHMSDFRAATLVDTQIDSSRLGLARLEGAGVERCSFSGSSCERLLLSGTTLVECSFDGANLEDATFDDDHLDRCTFRDARLTKQAGSKVLGRAQGSTFVGCDFRGVDWSGFRISRCTFEDCSFYGGRGAPGELDGVTIIGADMSVGADGSDIAHAETIVDRWKSGDLGGAMGG